MGTESVKHLKNGKRFGEILAILKKHQFTQGMTPEKLRSIFEDLGPTFVKFGQILSMRSDILPREYCAALEGLRTDVTPMPPEQVGRIISQRYDRPWQEIFSHISYVPLGSASIAQVHEAALLDGTPVVIKVQRPDIQLTMERDITLMKKAAGLMKYTPIGGALDFGKVLDEMWKALQEELDFGIEARNIQEFRDNNRDVAYVGCPNVITELSTRDILIMERIDGFQIDDTAGLTAGGYDLDEVATKLVNNYIKQITTDRFFHADPHPGNIRVQDGKIIWLDLGMMGRLTKREADLYMGIIKTIYDNDSLALTDVLLSLGQYERAPDRLQVCSSVDALLSKYKSMSMADMNLGSIVTEFVDMLNLYDVSVPSSLTMLGRSLLVIQGMLSGVTPELNVMEIVADYVSSGMIDKGSIEKKAKSVARQLLMSGDKLTMLPEQASDLMRRLSNGQAVVNVKQAYSETETESRNHGQNRLILGGIDCALIVSAAVSTLSPLPHFIGLPWPGTVFLACAAVVSAVLAAGGKKR